MVALRGQLSRLRKDLEALRGTPQDNPTLTALRADPTAAMRLQDQTPDPWQQTLLRSPSRRALMLTSRQCGKSTVAAALALRTALLTPASLVLLLSPSQRQSAELFRKVAVGYDALGRPVPTAGPRDNALKLELVNGSRIISLPGTEGTTRGYSGASLLVIDEAARVPDDLYRSCRPMLATSGGTLVAMSTPFGKRGWFYDAWTGKAKWLRLKVTADQCPRIPAEFLEEERSALGSRWYAQEYECSFEDVIGAVFAQGDIDFAVINELPPLVLN